MIKDRLYDLSSDSIESKLDIKTLSGGKPNHWKISTFVLTVILVIVLTSNAWVIVGSRKSSSLPILPAITSPSPSPTPSPQSKVTLIGTVRTGGQIDNNSYCSEGLYLVSAEGTYLINEISTLQLRVFQEDASVWNNTTLLSDRQYVGKRVRVSGKYPAQEVFCMAAMCACDDFILVDQIYE